jgi:hypothetical protein
MRQLSLILLLTTFSLLQLSAQIQIEWGKPIGANRAAPWKILGNYADQTFVIAVKGQVIDPNQYNYFLQRYNKESLELELERKIKVPGNTTIKAFELLQDKIVVYYVKDKIKAASFHSVVIDKDGKEVEKDQQIFEIEKNKMNSFFRPFRIRRSKNKKFLVTTAININHFNRKGREIIKGRVINDQLEVVREFEYDLEKHKVGEKRAYLIDFTVDNEGRVFAAIANYKGAFRADANLGLNMYDFEHIAIARLDQPTLEAKALDLSDYAYENCFISDMTIWAAENGELLFSGIWKNQKGYFMGDPDFKTGAVVVRYDQANLATKYTSFVEYLKDFELKEFAGGTNYNYLLLASEIDRMAWVEHGDIYLCIELYYHRSTILVLKLDPKGKPVWNKILHKKLGFFGSATPLNYFLHLEADGMYFLYNELEKNIGQSAGYDKTLKTSGKEIPAFMHLGYDGSLGKRLEIQSKIKKGKAPLLQPGTNYEEDADSYLIFGLKGSRRVLGRIRFE